MPSNSTRRAYRHDDDFLLMRRSLQRWWHAAGSDGGLLHVGDLTWQRFMYPREVVQPEEIFALWERPDGELDAFAVYFRKLRELSPQIDPALRGTERWRRIMDEMIAWADELQAPHPDEHARPLTVSERESHAGFAAYIAELGFARTDDPPMRFHHRQLSGGWSPVAPPAGFEVRAVREDELEQRVEIHREVWHPSRFTLEGYRQLRAAPGYDPTLDIVAVAEDGTLAAYAICWHDEVNHTGLFEPVGTRAAFRGRGLARAVLDEAMRRLRELGCEAAYVSTTEDREAACRLYRSAGFEVIDRWIYYRRSA